MDDIKKYLQFFFLTKYLQIFLMYLSKTHLNTFTCFADEEINIQIH